MTKKEIRKWRQIFQVLANKNRLAIISFLKQKGKMHVSDIANQLDISFTAASNNLRILANAQILQDFGKKGHVYYQINSEMPQEFKKTLHLIL